MPPRADRSHRDAVLRLRGVRITLCAGVRGCRATARALWDVDLVVWRGERVLVVGASADAATRLLLVASGALRPDSGDVWTAPGGRLVLGDHIARQSTARPVRGVAERVAPSRWSLRWAPDRGPGAELSVDTGALGGCCGATRVLRLRGGRLAPVSRVDSPFCAP